LVLILLKILLLSITSLHEAHSLCYLSGEICQAKGNMEIDLDENEN